jgi:predicted DNA-binding transcriptional regulator AlpA
MQSVAGEITGRLQEIEQLLASVEPAKCPAIIGSLEQLKALAWSILVCTQTRKNEAAKLLIRDRYLNVAEVAERFHVTAKWLYRHKKKLPHSQPSRKVLLFPEGPIQEWFAGRKMV